MKLRTLIVATVCVTLAACAFAQVSPSPWMKFVQVEGQPEPVPEQWVSTPEGKFAHSIKIPNPVQKNSGYRPGMSSEAYFNHLCKAEAGEFIYKTVDNVEGFYFMRPPKRPTDVQLKDRYALEAPEIERLFQSVLPNFEERAHLFVSPPRKLFRFVELPNPDSPYGQSFLRAYGYKANLSPMKADVVPVLSSRYGLVWRGIVRPHDRELFIAGGEWIVIDLKTNEVLAVKRQYGRTAEMSKEPGKVWWLSAAGCPTSKRPKTLEGIRTQLYEFNTKVLRPIQGE